MDKKVIIQEFVDFVEGRMSFEVFWNNYENNHDYRDLLDICIGSESRFTAWRKGTVNENIMLYDCTTCLGRQVVHRSIMFYLQYNNIITSPTTQYEDDVKFRQDIQPSYISIEDEEYFNSIIASAPTGLSVVQQKKWLKEKIKSLFVYEKSPPRWIQDPEWPIVSGKPLVFKGQTKNDPEDERIWYTFYDPDTGEETTVVQFY